ncbi:MAG: SRPBCC family protein [Acidimicrobiales bacterium]|jgi:uncharacterized protein YndB with AHSA1/START domain|nr:SRPBCC family protein [Acidimicrobiales bacterium]
MPENSRQVSVSRVIAAPPEKIFDVLADPAMHSVIDGSGSVKAAREKGSQRLAMGSTFSMDMKLGVPYVIKNTVVEFEENRRIAWRHVGGHRWRYELEPVEGGTEVTETFDWSTARVPKGIELMGYPKKHPVAMAKTLERLDEVVTQS